MPTEITYYTIQLNVFSGFFVSTHIVSTSVVSTNVSQSVSTSVRKHEGLKSQVFVSMSIFQSGSKHECLKARGRAT